MKDGLFNIKTISAKVMQSSLYLLFIGDTAVVPNLSYIRMVDYVALIKFRIAVSTEKTVVSTL